MPEESMGVWEYGSMGENNSVNGHRLEWALTNSPWPDPRIFL